VINWLGQEIYVGDYVGCGRRDGNTSCYRLGRVVDLDESKRTASVAWLYEPWDGNRNGQSWISIQTYTGRASIGSPGIDTLFLLDIYSLAPALRHLLTKKGN
jgi:hypothetical protein